VQPQQTAEQENGVAACRDGQQVSVQAEKFGFKFDENVALAVQELRVADEKKKSWVVDT